jgi:hypothetical protein
MDNLIRHYQGKTTSEGHELIVKRTHDLLSIGFKHAGEFQDEYDPYIHVARIVHTGDAYRVGWYFDDGEEPAESSIYTREEDLVAALDTAIEQRSKEVGLTGN